MDLGIFGSSQPHWVKHSEGFLEATSGSESFLLKARFKMMEPKLADFSLTTHQLVTKVRVNAVFFLE